MDTTHLSAGRRYVIDEERVMAACLRTYPPNTSRDGYHLTVRLLNELGIEVRAARILEENR